MTKKSTANKHEKLLSLLYKSQELIGEIYNDYDDIEDLVSDRNVQAIKLLTQYANSQIYDYVKRQQ